jgi:hypothetical protein
VSRVIDERTLVQTTSGLVYPNHSQLSNNPVHVSI